MHLKQNRRSAFKVAMIYVIMAGSWVVFSGEMVKWLVRNPDERIPIFILKGLALVLVTGGIVYLGLRRIFRQWDQEAEQRKQAEAARQATEEKLRRKEEKMQLVLDASAEGVWDWNLKTGIADLSPRYWEIIGHPAGEVVADRDFLKRLVHPEDWPTVEQALNEHFAGTTAQVVCEFRAIGKDGVARWTLVRGKVVERAPDGTPLRMVGTNSDITLRKLAGQQLRESEERYRQLFELESDAVILMDCENHRLLDVNLAAQQLYGYSREEFLQLKTEDLSDEPELTREIIGSGYFCVPLRWHRKKNGERIAVEITANQINHQGRLTELATVRDITIRQQTLQKLQETAQQLLAAQRIARIGSYGYDLTTGFWNCSVVLDELFGLAEPGFKKDLAGWLQIIHPENRDEMERYFKEDVVKARAEFDREYRIIRQKDQQVRWVHGLGRLILNDRGEVAQMVGIIQDITERKLAEEALTAERTLLRAVVDLLPDRIYVKDTQSRFLLGNEAVAQRMGAASPADLIGKSDAEFFPPQIAAEFRADELEVLKGVPLINKEESADRTDGAPEMILTTKLPLKDGSGKIIGLVGCGRNITDRKQAEQALQESQALYHSLVMQLPVGIFQKDQQGRFVLVNPEFCRLKNMKPEDFLGKTPREVTLSEAVKPHYDTLSTKFYADGEDHHQQIMRTGKSIELDEEYLLDGDRERFLHVIKLPVPGPDGKVIGTQGVQFDITERKLAERSLKLFRTLIERSSDGIYVVDPATGHFLDVNESACRVLGYSRDELLALTIFDVTVKPDRAIYTDSGAGIKNSGHVIQEVLHRRKDGSTYPVEASLSSVTLDREYLVTIVRDITERKRAEEAHARLATAVEQAAESIVITDIGGKILYVNPAFEKTSGYTRAEILGQTTRSLKSGKHNAEFYHRMWTVLGRGEIWSGHFINRRKDGEFFEEEATITPVRDAGGKIVNYVAVKRDVTREVQLEAQFRQSQKMEAIGQLAGGVAHDFNNILAVIQLQAGQLKSEAGLSRQQLEYASDIETAAQRAANLIRQLLMFGRKQSLQLRDLDLNEAVTGIAKMLQRILGEQIHIQFKFASQPLLIHADTSMLEQVMMNLAVNARDAMPKGGQLIVETEAVEFDEAKAAQTVQARPGSFVRVSVADTGFGIPPENLPRIFEPFFTTKDVGKGSGLGLATVFGIVQQHHGWINVYSETGRGTTFRVYLPRLDKPADKKILRPPLATIAGRKETILVVEDEPALRANVRSVLTRLGYLVLEASHGKAAIEVWKQHRTEIRLVLTDLVMPGGMTGVDLAGELLRQDPKLKVVFASGYSADIVSNDFPMVEGLNFLSKPFEVQKLAQIIRQRLDRE
jgi:PAS domain S-box-containing protein